MSNDPLAGDLLRFLYTVAESDEDTDGISVPAGEIKVSGEAIISRLNEVPVLSYAALADDVGHKVDGIRPMFVSGETNTDGTSIVLTFSEPISSADWHAMELQLNGANRQGLLGTIEAEHIDQKSVTVPLLTDFFFIDANDDVGFTFGGASVRDAAGNPNLGSRANVITNNVLPAPGVDSWEFTSDAGSDGTYAIGDTIELTVTFKREVTVNDTDGTPFATLCIGGCFDANERMAPYDRGSGTAELVFAYTVQLGDPKTNIISPSARAARAQWRHDQVQRRARRQTRPLSRWQCAAGSQGGRRAPDA